MRNQPNQVSTRRPWLDLARNLSKRIASAARLGPSPALRFRPARFLLSLCIIGLAVYWLASQIGSLENSISVIRVMSLGLVSLAGLAQIGSYLGAGYLLKVIADFGKTRLSVVRGSLITLAAASIGVVAGGWLGTAAAIYHWVANSEDTPEEAALAGLLPPLFNNVLLVGVAVVGLAYLLMAGRLTSLQMAGDGLFLAVVGLGLAIVIYGLSHQPFIERLIVGLVAPLLRFLRRAGAVDSLRDRMNQTFRGLTLLRKKGWVRPVLGAAFNIGFDMLTLYLLFMATGQAARVGVLLAGYGLAFLLGKIAYLFPGGVGVIESGMTAIYTGLGVPVSISVVVVLSYRLLSFWIPVLLGFAVAAYLQRTSTPKSAPLADPVHLNRRTP